MPRKIPTRILYADISCIDRYLHDKLHCHGLELLAQHALARCSDFEEHPEQYSRHVAEIAKENPLIINTHTGRDWFSFEQNQEIIAAAVRVSNAGGIPVVHETHRGRFSFCAAITHRFLKADPELRLCADFSHWCTVSESFLADQQLAVEAAIQRTDHIHARIGFDQGPQVNDPRAPEWQSAIQIFLGWWDKIVACHEEKRSEFLAHHHRVRPDTIHANPAAAPTACCEPMGSKPVYA